MAHIGPSPEVPETIPVSCGRELHHVDECAVVWGGDISESEVRRDRVFKKGTQDEAIFVRFARRAPLEVSRRASVSIVSALGGSTDEEGSDIGVKRDAASTESCANDDRVE